MYKKKIYIVFCIYFSIFFPVKIYACININSLVIIAEFKICVFSCSRPGGELNAGEDEVEGLKRLLTEVTVSTTPYAALQAGWEWHFHIVRL